jgi:hypothetical protein
MTDKEYRKKVKNLGGIINPTCSITWTEDTVEVKNNQEAIDVIDILQWENITDVNKPDYSPDMNPMLDGLRTFLEKGLV